MLTNYFESPRTLGRLRSCVVGPFVEDFIQRLEANGYSRRTIRGYLSTATHLGVWADGQNLTAGDLDETVAKKFVAHLKKCSCLRRNHGKYPDALAHVR